MTLPSSGSISMSQMANEVGLSLPVSINHAWLLKLIGKAGFPISFSDFYGKTGRIDGSFFAATAGSGATITFGNPAFFGSSLNSGTLGSPGGNFTLVFNSTPGWTGNLLFKNNTTGASVVMNNSGGGLSNQFSIGSTPGNLVRAGQTDNFSITPSN
jgi:hypothetical protein